MPAFRDIPEPPRLLGPTRPVHSLDSRWATRLTAVVGETGSGRTTTLARSVRDSIRTGAGLDLWLSCQRQDRLPDQLGEALLDALVRRLGDPGSRSLEDPLRRLRDRIWGLAPLQVGVIIDELDILGHRHEDLTVARRLLEELPQNAHVVIATSSLDVVGSLAASTTGEVLIVECGERVLPTPLPPVDDAVREVLQALRMLGPLDESELAAVLRRPVDLAAEGADVPGLARSGTRYHTHPLWDHALPAPSPEQRRRWCTAAAEVAAAEPDVERALALAVRAQDWSAAVAVIARGALAMTYQGITTRLAQWLAELPVDSLGPGAARLAESMLQQAPAGEPDRVRLHHAVAALDEEHPPLALVAMVRLTLLSWHAGDLERLRWCRERAARQHGELGELVRDVMAVLVADLEGDLDQAASLLSQIRFGTAPEPLRSFLMTFHCRQQLSHGSPALVIDLANHLEQNLEPAHCVDLTVLRAWAAWHDGDYAGSIGELASALDASTGTHAGLAQARADLALRESWLPGTPTGQQPSELLQAAAEDRAHGLAEPALVHVLAAAVRLVAEGEEDRAREVLAEALPAGDLPRYRRALARGPALVGVLLPHLCDDLAAALPGPVGQQGVAAARALLEARAGRTDRPLPTDPRSVLSVLPPTWTAELVLRRGADCPESWPGLVAALEPAGRDGVRALEALAAGDDDHLAAAARTALDRWVTTPRGTFLLRLLGPAVIEHDGERLPHPGWRRERVRALLALLARRREIPRADAADTLWPELDPAARANNLRVTLSYLQQVLEPDRERGSPPVHVAADAHSIRFVGRELWQVDVESFEGSLDEAAAHDARGEAAAALEALRSAVDTYGGAWLADLRIDPAEEIERARLQSRFVAGAVRLAELLVADDSLTEAQRVLARVQAEDPASESASALAIGLYVKAGDRAAALREYRRIEALLAELELTPSPQLLAAAGSLRP